MCSQNRVEICKKLGENSQETWTDRFPTTSNEMPGLIMTHVPSDLTRRTSPNNYNSETLHAHNPSASPNSSARLAYSAPQMTISTASHPASSASGPHHGGAACAMMSASSTSRIMRPVERLRLREWLKKMIEAQAIPGLHWIDKERQIVKIPWKHAARHGWSRDKDACLFRAWAIHTKKYDPTTDSPKANPKVWKANFRCAINSLPDIEELREKGKTKGNDAYKVYRLHPKKSKRQSRETDGSKVIKRQRSTSKSRVNRPDKKQRKRNGLVIPSPENLNKLSDHSPISKLSNASDDLAEDLLKKRMAEISAAYSMTESAKSDRMRLNVHCVFKPNGTSSTVSSGSLLSPMSPPSTLQSPTTPYSSTMSTNGHHFASPNAYSTTHSTCVSPCSTVTSTPASTPQSPPPSYHFVMNNRQGMGYMEARFELSRQHQLGYESYHEDLSDSDSSSGRMSEKEVADLVFELKDNSPGNSPRSLSPLDGNNNVDPAVDYSTYWNNHPRHPADDNRTFFGNGCDIMTAQNNRVVPTDLPGYEPNPMMTHIKIEPETLPPMSAHQHHNAMLNGYDSTASLALNAQHHDAYADSNYLLHQL